MLVMVIMGERGRGGRGDALMNGGFQPPNTAPLQRLLRANIGRGLDVPSRLRSLSLETDRLSVGDQHPEFAVTLKTDRFSVGHQHHSV